MSRVCIYLTFSFVFLMQLSFAQLPQQWLRSHNVRANSSDRVQNIYPTANGDVIISGSSAGKRNFPDAFAMRYASNGDTLWFYRYDGPAFSDDYAYAMTVDANENVYLTGKSRAAGTGWDELITIKLNSAGVQQWVYRYSPTGGGDSRGNSIAVDPNGNVYVAGWFDGPSSSRDWLVLKFNPSGVVQWTDIKNSALNGTDECTKIIIDAIGNPIACGFMYDNLANGYVNAYVKKYNSAGGMIWEDYYTNPVINYIDNAIDLKENSVGDIIVVGETNNATGFNRDPFVISYSPLGVRNYTLIVPDSGSNDVSVMDMDLDANDNIYFTSYDYNNILVSKVSSTGVFQWKKFWRGPIPFSYDVSFSIGLDINGNAYTTGRGIYPGPSYYGNGGTDNLVVVKFASNGDSLWTYRPNMIGTASMGFALAVRNNKVYAGGFATDTAEVNENLLTVVLDTAGQELNKWIYNGVGEAVTLGQFVCSDANNNLYCAATVNRQYYHGYDIAVVKYNSAGTLLWESIYTSPGWKNDTITAFRLDNLGRPIISLSTDTNATKSGYQLSLLKMDVDGHFIDTAVYSSSLGNNSFASDMIISSNNDIYLAAKSTDGRGLLMHCDSTLQITWSATIDSTLFTPSEINQLALFSNGDVGLAGFIQISSGNNWKGVVQRFDALGNRIWSTDIDSAGVSDNAEGLAINSLDEVAVTGASGTTAFTCKLDNSGNISWRKINNTNTSSEFGIKCEFLSNGNVVTLTRGWTGFVAQHQTSLFQATDGTLLWTKVYNQTASDREPKKLLVDPSDRIVTAGWEINIGSTNADYNLVGYTTTGTQLFANKYTSSGLNPDYLRDLCRDSAGSYIITGQSANDFMNEFLYKMITIKYGSGVTSLETTTTINSVVTVYPNPTHQSLTILNTSLEDIREVIIYNISGRLINNFGKALELDLSVVHSGMYLLQISQTNGQLLSTRIIKE
jgi:hypothetical protein